MIDGSWLAGSRERGGREGSALIVALWVVGLLSMLVTCFAFDAHIESRITSYYRKRRKAEYLARSGIEIAELLMNKSEEMQKTKSTDEDEEDQQHRPFAADERQVRDRDQPPDPGQRDGYRIQEPEDVGDAAGQLQPGQGRQFGPQPPGDGQEAGLYALA